MVILEHRERYEVTTSRRTEKLLKCIKNFTILTVLSLRSECLWRQFFNHLNRAVSCAFVGFMEYISYDIINLTTFTSTFIFILVKRSSAYACYTAWVIECLNSGARMVLYFGSRIFDF